MYTTNVGSLARDHMANERTVLAWIRTGLALIAIGLAFSKFASGYTSILHGSLLILLGIVFLIYSGVRYYEIKEALKDGKFVINETALYILLSITIISTFGALLTMIYMNKE